MNCSAPMKIGDIIIYELLRDKTYAIGAVYGIEGGLALVRWSTKNIYLHELCPTLSDMPWRRVVTTSEFEELYELISNEPV